MRPDTATNRKENPMKGPKKDKKQAILIRLAERHLTLFVPMKIETTLKTSDLDIHIITAPLELEIDMAELPAALDILPDQKQEKRRVS